VLQRPMHTRDRRRCVFLLSVRKAIADGVATNGLIVRRHFYFPGERERIMPRFGRGKKVPYELPLSPIKKPPHERGILIYDAETKRGLSQTPGFDRLFLMGFLDHRGTYLDFWDDRNQMFELETGKLILPDGLDYRERAHDPDEGIIDQFARTVLGHPHRAGYHPPEWTSDWADLYGHNAGKFDVTPLLVWLHLHRDEFHTEVTFVQGRVQSLRVSPARQKPSRKNTVSFLDSFLILPMKLAQAARLFSRGMRKDDKFDQATPEWDREQWRKYNKLDCVGLRDSLLGFRGMLQAEGGELAMTLPSASMKIFRRRFLGDSIDRAVHFPGCDNECGGCTRGVHCDGKCHGCLHDWIKRGYFGGRVEIFERFAPAPVYYYDLNSSYPASMLALMPVGKPVAIQTEEEFFAEHEQRFKSGQVGFVECEVFIPTTCPIPPLPSIKDGKLKFRVGRFHGVFEYEELMTIMDPFVGGRINKVKMAVWYEGSPLFREFVETLYKYKLGKPDRPCTCEKGTCYLSPEEHDKLALAELAKLLLNSLYGKFAQNPEREELFYVGPQDPWPTHEQGRPLDGKQESPFWLRPKYVSPSYVAPHLSARVTALSRKAIWEQAKRIVLAGGRVYYMDTDALPNSMEFSPDVVHPTRLGAWKREHPEKYLAGEFVQPKLYALFNPNNESDKAIVHMKGVPRELQNMESFRLLTSGGQLHRPADHPDNKRFSPPKSVLRSLLKGGPMGIYMVESIKQLRSKYDKRQVLADGTTIPEVADEPM
jgi:DNA polymerase family B